MMGKRVWIPAAVLALSVAAGCGRSIERDTTFATQSIQPADPPEPTAIPYRWKTDPSPDCPTARGVGTVPPDISIHSITFLVNGKEQVVFENHVLQADAGDEVKIRTVSICSGSFSGEGGQACVDFAPTDEHGQKIMSEHKGTDTVRVIPGTISISNLNFTWTVGRNWSGFYAVLNHWAPVETQDPDCANGLCERDDWFIVEFH